MKTRFLITGFYCTYRNKREVLLLEIHIMLICSLILNAKLKIIAHQATYLIKKEDNTTVGRDGIFLLLLNRTLNLLLPLKEELMSNSCHTSINKTSVMHSIKHWHFVDVTHNNYWTPIGEPLCFSKETVKTRCCTQRKKLIGA